MLAWFAIAGAGQCTDDAPAVVVVSTPDSNDDACPGSGRVPRLGDPIGTAITETPIGEPQLKVIAAPPAHLRPLSAHRPRADAVAPRKTTPRPPAEAPKSRRAPPKNTFLHDWF